ncbi:MAG: C39 family peptidase [Anaerolineae bacterium]
MLNPRRLLPMGGGSIPACAVSCLTILSLIAELLSGVASHRDLRHAQVVGQSSNYTCGPAAVSTLLTYYYGIPITEMEALELAEAAMRAEGGQPGRERGINALALLRVLEAKGIPTTGYRVSLGALHDYFERGGLPLIAHLTTPNKHFVVAVGVVNDHVVLADPTWGRSIIPFSALIEERGYRGVVLVPIPNPGITQRVRAAQQATLTWARQRLAALSRLRESLP